MRDIGLTTPAEAVATGGPADTDDVDRALDFALDFHQIEMYLHHTVLPFANNSFLSPFYHLIEIVTFTTPQGLRALPMEPKLPRQATLRSPQRWGCSEEARLV